MTARDLARALRRDGIYIRIGSHTVRIQSPFPAIAHNLRLLYADYPLELNAAFADFHVSVKPPKSFRRWLAPQAIFRFDSYVPFKPLPADQAYPLLEWGLNWCFSTQFHRYLVIHAAVLEKNGRAVLMPAPPGSGKSTLCAALATRGWRLLSDELTLVEPETNKIIPMCRPVSLKNESIQIIQDFDATATLGPPAFDTSKGTVGHMRAPTDSVLRGQETAMPAWIVFPKYEADSIAQLADLSKASTFMKVADNSFNYSMLGLRGFETVAKLVDQCDCYEFKYSNLDEAIAIFNKLSEA